MTGIVLLLLHHGQLAAAAAATGAAGCPPTPPLSALSAGADVVLQSSHKVLTAMTQAAMMHVRGQRVSSSRISRALQVSCGVQAAGRYGLGGTWPAAHASAGHCKLPGGWGVGGGAAGAGYA